MAPQPEYVCFPADYTLKTPDSRPGYSGLHWICFAQIEVLMPFVKSLKSKGKIFITVPVDLQSIQKFKVFEGTTWMN